jgi:hypothetical protein
MDLFRLPFVFVRGLALPKTKKSAIMIGEGLFYTLFDVINYNVFFI